MAPYYPAFLNLRGRCCLVVGGGSVAVRKVAVLLEAEAAVRVVSPDLDPELARLAAAGRLAWTSRAFEAGDVAGAFLVVAATDDQAINRAVAEEAEAAGRLLNVVDTPDLCNFIVPSVIRRGPVTIAISTGGQSPALARQIREELEVVLPADLADQLAELTELRALLRKRLPTPAAREEVWRNLLADGLVELLRAGNQTAARNLADSAADRWIAARTEEPAR